MSSRAAASRALAEFLQSQLSLVVAVLLFMAVTGLLAAAKDGGFRRDLRNAVLMLGTAIVIRACVWVFPLAPGAERLALLAWVLLFSFGSIRAVVSIALRLARVGRPPPPKILRDVVDFSLYALAAVVIAKAQLNIDLTGVVATSAILSVVVGLALQETLGNLFAGLSLQVERPFEVGDWISVDHHTGRVVQVAWRATRIETTRLETVTLPNGIVAKQALVNHSRSGQPVGIDAEVGLSYRTPPNLARELCLEAAREVFGVLESPAPTCRIDALGDSAIRYRVRVFLRDYAQVTAARDELWTRLWYRLERAGVEVPFPQRTLSFGAAETPALVDATSRRELLGSVDLFSELEAEVQEQLLAEMQSKRFGQGERIISEGTEGHTFYVVASGEVSVRSTRSSTEVARLGRGTYFGEMSLLTGEPRAATVVAQTDTVLLELDRPTFARLFDAHPGLARQLSARLAERRSKLHALSENVASTSDTAPEAQKILARLRQIFRLRGE